MKRLAIVTTHPIQYYAPVFQGLAKQHSSIKVFYTWGEESIKKYDPDFKKDIEWDVPLLEGYPYQFLVNTAKQPGTSHFKGIINPDAVRIIEEFNPDALLVYGWSWHSHLKIIRHFSGKKKIWFRGDSTCLDKTTWYKSFIRKQWLRWIYGYVDLAFYVGKENKKYFSDFGLKEHQLQFAPHAIDNRRFSSERAEDVKILREKLRIPHDGVLILFAGKLEPKKDPFTLLRAFESISSKHVFLLFAGNGVLENELKAKVAQSHLVENIRFLDFQNQSFMPTLYQASQVFCLPSAGPGETWGLAVNEAMAAGKPVIVSDKVGCAADLVKDGINGAIFKHQDHLDLAAKLRLLLAQNENLPKFGRASQKIIEKWSFELQVSTILDAVNNLS